MKIDIQIEPDTDLGTLLVAGRRAAYSAIVAFAEANPHITHHGVSPEFYDGLSPICIHGVDMVPFVDAAVEETLARLKPAGIVVMTSAAAPLELGGPLWQSFWRK